MLLSSFRAALVILLPSNPGKRSTPVGAWGGGLYDSDFALDLKRTINGVLRAPLSDDEIVAEIWSSHGDGAVEADALDYWLVLADQFERRGIKRQDVFERAIAIIEADEDVAVLELLEAEPQTVAQRRRETTKLLERLRDPRPAKQRRPLKKPQSLLLEPGGALTWPTDRGDSINPYVREDMLCKLGGFAQDGWGFGIVTEAGHYYDVIAYYAVQVLKWRRVQRPTPELAVHCPRSAHHYGTLKELHLKRSRVERLGRVPDEALGPPLEPEIARRNARRAALEDIGLTDVFGLDAWNSSVWPDLKFVFPAPSGKPLDPDEPDQRPGPFDQATGRCEPPPEDAD